MDTPAQRCAKCPRRVEDFGMQLEGAMILGRNGARAACEELRGEANIQRCQDQVVKAMKIGVEIVQRMFPARSTGLPVDLQCGPYWMSYCSDATRSGSPALRTWSCVQCEQSLDLLKDLFGRHLLAFNTIIPEWLCQKGDITCRALLHSSVTLSGPLLALFQHTRTSKDVCDADLRCVW
ncbi:unnamed protein product, partial [Mesorhabditis spiculigera]